MYSYKEFSTGKTRRTRGKFLEWRRGGLANDWGAVFENPKSLLFIPGYCLTKETIEQIPPWELFHLKEIDQELYTELLNICKTPRTINQIIDYFDRIWTMGDYRQSILGMIEESAKYLKEKQND